MSVDLKPGWNAGARSIRWETHDCEATVTPLERVTGVFVGLSAATDVTSLREQTHSLLFRYTPAGSFADVYESGVFVETIGAYVDGDAFKIRRVSGVVTMYQNDVLEYTSAAPSTGTVFLTAAMYLAGDQL